MTRTSVLLVALGALAASVPFATSAEAQWGQRPGFERDQPDYRPPGWGGGGGFDEPEDDWRWRRRDREDYGYDYGYGRRRGWGRVCVTSRGSCAGPAAPIGARCRCMIPGFGQKRGNIQY